MEGCEELESPEEEKGAKCHVLSEPEATMNFRLGDLIGLSFFFFFFCSHFNIEQDAFKAMESPKAAEALFPPGFTRRASKDV